MRAPRLFASHFCPPPRDAVAFSYTEIYDTWSGVESALEEALSQELQAEQALLQQASTEAQ